MTSPIAPGEEGERIPITHRSDPPPEQAHHRLAAAIKPVPGPIRFIGADPERAGRASRRPSKTRQRGTFPGGIDARIVADPPKDHDAFLQGRNRAETAINRPAGKPGKRARMEWPTANPSRISTLLPGAAERPGDRPSLPGREVPAGGG